jgi:hypothetical protein
MKYRIEEGPIRLGPGFVLALTPEQLVHRSDRLNRRDDGSYAVVEPVEFKTGEVVEVLEGEIGKAVLDKLRGIGGQSRLKV